MEYQGSERRRKEGNGPYCGLTTYDADEEEFLRAIQAHQKRCKTKFLPFSEILKVVKSLGYRKVAVTDETLIKQAPVGRTLEPGGDAHSRNDGPA